MTDKKTQKPTSHQQTLQQERAASAWQHITIVDKNPDEKKRKKYGSLVRGLAANILSDGIGPTLAFLRAKGEDHHNWAYDHLAAWITTQMPGLEGDLLEWLIKQGSYEYRLVTAEALAYLHWLKRFAEAKGWKSDED